MPKAWGWPWRWSRTTTSCIPAVIAPVLQLAPHPALSVIWDVGNSYSVGDEPAVTFQALRRRLAYVQIKDGIGQGSAWRLTDVGAGAVPLAWAVEQLVTVGYRGVYSVEWERAWHPELAPADEALPAARDALFRWLAAAAAKQAASGAQ